MVIWLELGADLHTAQLMPLPLTVSCFSKIQIGFTFLVATHLGSPGQAAVKRVCLYPQPFAFSSLTLLVGRREEHLPVKKRVMRCWCGYPSGARWRPSCQQQIQQL